MAKKFSAEWYRVRVQRVIAKAESNGQMDKEVLDLINDRRLKALNNELAVIYTKRAEEIDEAPGNRDRQEAYASAEKALSQSPWRRLWHFIEKLPLVSMFELAGKNVEVRKLFLERLKGADDESRERSRKFKQAMKGLIDSLSNDTPLHQASNAKSKISEPLADGAHHPLKAILDRSTFGGGALGATSLAEELDDYCTQQLQGYIKWNQRTKKSPSSRIQSGHVGKLNAIGILTTLFTPRKAQERLKAATEAIEQGETKRVFFITPKEIEAFFKKKHVKRFLSHLK